MDIEQLAKEQSNKFLNEEKQYRLGFVEAEQKNKITAKLGETFVKNTSKGVKLLLKADMHAGKICKKVILSKEFDTFYEAIKTALLSNHKIIISGCGSTGRLAMRIEASFREAISALPGLEKYQDKVISLMTGGDYAIIRSVESFEDYIELGEKQAEEVPVEPGDLLIGVTATGETTSILGSARYALKNNANVYMVVCTKPESIIHKLERAQFVYTHPNCRSLYIPCGGMAVTGSTRMQSSSIEQTIIYTALELTICELLNQKVNKRTYADIFVKCVSALNKKSSVTNIANQIDTETNLYNENGHVTYFATEYLLDILSDTTERGPTFSVPHFRPQSKKDLPLSWAFVKNPTLPTKEAWNKVFERTPRCIDKTVDEYEKIGIKKDDIKKIPIINLNALHEFEIGNESDEEREKGNSLATLVDLSSISCDKYESISQRYKTQSSFVPLKGINLKKNQTYMNIFEHLAMKLSFNNMSTGTMAKMKRIRGNYMVFISISNKKLVDRATRIISDLCKLSYEEANYQLYLSNEMLNEKKLSRSPVEFTLERFGIK